MYVLDPIKYIVSLFIGTNTKKFLSYTNYNNVQNFLFSCALSTNDQPNQTLLSSSILGDKVFPTTNGDSIAAIQNGHAEHVDDDYIDDQSSKNEHNKKENSADLIKLYDGWNPNHYE